MPLITLNGPILLAGESLSGPIAVGGDIVRIVMPQKWDSANLSFQISDDGQNFNDLFTYHGREAMISVVPGTTVVVPDALSRSINYLRFRSGPRSHPVPQTEDRLFAVIVEQGNKATTEDWPQ